MNPISANNPQINNFTAPKPPSAAREAFAQQMARALGSNINSTNSNDKVVNSAKNLASEISQKPPQIQGSQSKLPINEAPRLGMVLDIKV